jgi:hypothetical protein
MRPVSSCLTRVSVGVLFMGLVAGCVSYSTGGGNLHVTEAMIHARKAVEPGNIGAWGCGGDSCGGFLTACAGCQKGHK